MALAVVSFGDAGGMGGGEFMCGWCCVGVAVAEQGSKNLRTHGLLNYFRTDARFVSPFPRFRLKRDQAREMRAPMSGRWLFPRQQQMNSKHNTASKHRLRHGTRRTVHDDPEESPAT